MKILHITDSHGTVKGPESRKDIYYISFLKKFYELGFVIKKNNIDMVIHTGDLFHTARVSDKFAGQLSEIIKSWNIPVYVVPGNHDIEGYTTNTIDQTKLGLLSKTGVITILDRDNPIVVTGNCNGKEFTVAISGQEYYAHIDEKNWKDFEMQQDEADLNILAIHGYIADTPQHPDIKCTMCQDIISDADIILTGHYHRQFEWSDGNNLDIFNPGSMMRVEQTEYNKTHMPQYGILDIGLDKHGYVEWDYNFYEFRIAQPSTVIFDYDSKYKAKQTSITLEGFKNSIANSMNTFQNVTNIENIINNICNDINNNITTELHNLTLKSYNDTLQTIPDEFEVQQGFIQGAVSKKISRVILRNFQSHEYTEVDFHNGLNIIVGESNNGKTSILRGIMWVIDNHPLGTDFIMAGKNSCSVKIEYDDGTFIERGRSLKDTGYYHVRYINENGNFDDQTYRGFTNAVPVEVANVHQMPKVNITKDIETHLNVLSQLDGPFLLTESPLVKASAIGRITGTHVVDAAIKNNNKTVLNNKKLIKEYNKDLLEKQNELQRLPDVNIMSKFSTNYSLIVDKIKQLEDFITTAQKYQTNISELDTKLCQEKNKLSIYTRVCRLSPVVKHAEFKLVNVIETNNKYTKICEIENSIIIEQKKLDKQKTLQVLGIVVDYTCEKLFNAFKHLNYIEKINEINTDIESQISVSDNIKSSIQIKQDCNNSLNDIIIYCNYLQDYIEKCEPKHISINSISSSILEEQRKLESNKTSVKKFKGQAVVQQNIINKFVLDNKICPCCGQNITEEHVSNITLFMKE